MGDKILLFESRDLCYESNQYFMECLEDEFVKKGYTVEICDLSVQMEDKLEGLLKRQEQYKAAFDFNSLIPRLELEDGTPYLEAFEVPFYNYLVDHPLYHHVGLKRGFFDYSVICIDTCHRQYVKRHYPHIERVYTLPLGAMQADMKRSWNQKRFELLFLGTYESENLLYQDLADYPKERQTEIRSLIEAMEDDSNLTQEAALEAYLKSRGENLSPMEFAVRLNQDYLADKYLRNRKRRQEVLAAAESGVPFTVIGHGWEQVKELRRKNVTIRNGVGFAASIQMMADAKLLLNTTPGFHGGLHDRVYSGMLNECVCLTERSHFAENILEDGRNILFYDSGSTAGLTECICRIHEHPDQMIEIAQNARKKAMQEYTWEQRTREIINIIEQQ